MQQLQPFQDQRSVAHQQFARSSDSQSPMVPEKQPLAQRILERTESFARG